MATFLTGEAKPRRKYLVAETAEDIPAEGLREPRGTFLMGRRSLRGNVCWGGYSC